jgi:hypothetical protein
MKRPVPSNFKEVVIAILIGASVSFLTVMFDGFAEYLRTNGDQLMAGAASIAYYLAKSYRV